MRTKRQNIQLELALEPAAKGEARSAGAQGTGPHGACRATERPATPSNRRVRPRRTPVWEGSPEAPPYRQFALRPCRVTQPPVPPLTERYGRGPGVRKLRHPCAYTTPLK